MGLTRTIKVGDRGQPLAVRYVDGAGDPIDFTNAVGIVLRAYDADHNRVIDDVAARFDIDRTNGWTFYDWQAADTLMAGKYPALHKVDWGGSATPESFPNDGHFVIEVEEDWD